MKIYLIIAFILLTESLPSYGTRCPDEFLRHIRRNPFQDQTITIVTTNDVTNFVEQVAGGVPFGFSVDLMNYIAFIYRAKFQYVYTTFDELIPAVQSDENTISVNTQTITPARAQLIDFAQFFETGSVFLVKSSYNGVINGLSDLCGKKVGVQSGTIHVTDLQDQNTKCGSNPIQITTVITMTERNAVVLNGTVDVVIGDEANLIPVARQSNQQLKVVGTPYNVEPFGIGCNKNNRELCCGLVDAINYLIREGLYDQLLTRYSYTYSNNGICPSRINLKGGICSQRCTLGARACARLWA